MKLKMFVEPDIYISFARTSDAYLKIFRTELADLIDITDDPEEADVAFFLGDMKRIGDILTASPALQNCYTIGFLVWETDLLPKKYAKIIQDLDEIWTSSLYCWRCFDKYHDKVYWVPHVTDDYPLSTSSDIERMKKDICYDVNNVYFMVMGGYYHIRKNCSETVDAFNYVHARYPDTRLIWKVDHRVNDVKEVRFERDGLIYVVGYIANSRMAALYDIAHVYVSSHHSEGWGLTISDAMQHGVLCVATGYSGNMDFMTRSNSLLVDYVEHKLDAESEQLEFTREMTWGTPCRESLETQMLKAYRAIRTGEYKDIVKRAKEDIGYFNASHVALIVRDRILNVIKRLS